jgi:hypothetical protein
VNGRTTIGTAVKRGPPKGIHDAQVGSGWQVSRGEKQRAQGTGDVGEKNIFGHEIGQQCGKWTK